MKKIMITGIAVLTLTGNIFAGQQCYEDFLGNWVCNGTGSDSGFSSKSYQDFLGNWKYSDNRGNNSTCYWDFLGNWVCN